MDRLDLSLGFAVIVSERAPGLIDVSPAAAPLAPAADATLTARVVRAAVIPESLLVSSSAGPGPGAVSGGGPAVGF